jgi:pimeloyl-ACP methyl ester carboxylesterase
MDQRGRTMLVMVPGAHFRPGDFADHGFLEALNARGSQIDAIEARLNPDDYLDGDVAGRLHREIIGPALARGYSRLWLLGISLGGMGALLYARAHPDIVDGVILLAPFLATRGTIAEIVAAGGLANWNPEPKMDLERGLLAWLKTEPFREGGPLVYLGYGRADRYADASRVLSPQLPPERIVVAQGGHDWAAWTVLWQRILTLTPVAAGG